MLPPNWATGLGTRLSMDGFAVEFGEAWERLERRFIKLECWQTYQEQASNRSHDEYKLGNVVAATRLLEIEAETDRPLYERIKSEGLEYARVRLVKLPLSSYLQYELISYRIREQMGENIEAVLVESDVSVPSEELFDFLLFDRRTALVHDYGTDGCQVGGWRVDDPDVVERLERTAVQLRASAVTVNELLRDNR